MNRRRSSARGRRAELAAAVARLEELERLGCDTSAIEIRIMQIEQDPEGSEQPDYETW